MARTPIALTRSVVLPDRDPPTRSVCRCGPARSSFAARCCAVSSKLGVGRADDDVDWSAIRSGHLHRQQPRINARPECAFVFGFLLRPCREPLAAAQCFRSIGNGVARERCELVGTALAAPSTFALTAVSTSHLD